MNLSADYDPPVYVKIAGERVAFPRLTLDDLDPIQRKLADAEAERIERLAEQCRLSPWERFRALQEAERIGIGVPDLVRYFRTRDGIAEAWRMSNDKAKRTAEEREPLRRALGVLALSNLAISLLSTPEDPPAPASGGPQRPDPTQAPTT